MSGEEWYPQECGFGDWAAALGCRDPFCRERGFGEHRTDCASVSDPSRDCDCLLAAIEAQ